MPESAAAHVSAPTARLASRCATIEVTERPPGCRSSASEALARARDLATRFAEGNCTNRGELLHALETLARVRPAKDVRYDDMMAAKQLRRAMHDLARRPEHADIVWRGCVVAHFTEAFRDEPVATTVTNEYSRPAGVTWKRYSDTYFGPTEARATYDALFAANVVPAPGRSLRFVSAAANSATHEAAMFERDSEISPDRDGGRQFIVGDIAEIASRALPGPTHTGDFLHVRWNAGELPLKPSSVDVIWDRKGCTWYALMNDYQSPNQATGRSPLMGLAVLAHYAEILKPGGSIVLDAIPAGLLPQAERSTLDAIELVSRESGIDVMRLVAARFDVSFVGEGVTRCLVVRKRSR